MTRSLRVLRVAIAHADKPTVAIGLVNVAAVDRTEVERDNIAPPRGDGHRVRVPVLVCREVGCADPIHDQWRVALGCRSDHVRDIPVFVRAIEEPDLTILVKGVVEVHQDIRVAQVVVSVERMVLSGATRGKQPVWQTPVHGCTALTPGAPGALETGAQSRAASCASLNGEPRRLGQSSGRAPRRGSAS